MLNVHISSKKKTKKKNCVLLPLGSLFLLGLNSAPLSLYLSLLKPTLEGKKKGGATSVDSRLTGELVADIDLSGFSDPRSNGPVLFCFVMSSQKSLAAYPPTTRLVIQQLSIG